MKQLHKYVKIALWLVVLGLGSFYLVSKFLPKNQLDGTWIDSKNGDYRMVIHKNQVLLQKATRTYGEDKIFQYEDLYRLTIDSKNENVKSLKYEEYLGSAQKKEVADQVASQYHFVLVKSAGKLSLDLDYSAGNSYADSHGLTMLQYDKDGQPLWGETIEFQRIKKEEMK